MRVRMDILINLVAWIKWRDEIKILFFFQIYNLTDTDLSLVPYFIQDYALLRRPSLLESLNWREKRDLVYSPEASLYQVLLDTEYYHSVIPLRTIQF